MQKLFNLFLAMILTTLTAHASGDKPEYHVVHGTMSLYAIKKGDKYQLYNNAEKKLISKNTYDKIHGCYAYSGWTNKIVVVSSGGKFGLIDAVNGKEILRPVDSPITAFTDGIYTPEPLVWHIGGKRETLTSMPIHIDTGSGYTRDLNPVIYYYTYNLQTYEYQTPRSAYHDKQGRQVIPPLYESAGAFIDGIALVAKDGKHGAINTAGEQVIPFDYDKIEEIPRGNFLKLIKTTDNNRSLNGIANRSGAMLIPCEFDNIEIFQHKTPDNAAASIDLFYVRKRAADNILTYGLRDLKGNEIFPVKYAGISDDSHGRFILYASAKKAGMADNDGNIIIPMLYSRLSSIDSDYILVWQDGKCGLVTPHREILIPPDKFEAINLKNMHGKTFFFAQISKKWGQIDRTGEILLAPKYEAIEPYREKDDDSLVVLLDGQWMRIDRWGAEVERFEKNPYEIPMLFPPHLANPPQEIRPTRTSPAK